MKQIEVVVSPEGEVVINAVGFKGQGCEQATKALEQAMGTSGKRTKKPEWTQQSTQKVGA